MEAKRAIKKKAPLSIRFIEQTSISKEALALVCSKGHKSAPQSFHRDEVVLRQASSTLNQLSHTWKRPVMGK